MGAVFPGGAKDPEPVLSAEEREEAVAAAQKEYHECRCTRVRPRDWRAKQRLQLYEDMQETEIRGNFLEKEMRFKGWRITSETTEPRKQWIRVEGKHGKRVYVCAQLLNVEDVSDWPEEQLEDKEAKGKGEEVKAKTEPWPFWGTLSEDLGEYYGPGVRLHFRWLGLLSAVSLVAAMLSLPLVYFSSIGGALDPFLTGTEGWLRESLLSTTLGNLGTEDLELHGVWVKNSHITSHAGMQDALVVLIVFGAAVWFERHCIRDAVEDEHTRFVTAGNFALEVTRLPAKLPQDDEEEEEAAGGQEGDRCAYQEALRAHFDALLSASVTAENVKRGLAVVRADDPGVEKEKDQVEGFLCCRRRLRDHKGRRLGRVVKLDRDSCLVLWAKVDGNGGGGGNGKQEPEKEYFVKGGKQVLRHVPLLAALESHGLNVGEDGVSRIEEVALVRRKAYEKLQEAAKHNNKCVEGGKRATGTGNRNTMVGDVNGEPWTLRKFNRECRKLDVVSAYVIFKHVQYRDFLEQAYRFSHFRPGRWTQPKHHRFMDSAIEVAEAPVPGDIMWQNLDLEWYYRCVRKVISLMACFGLLSVIIIFLTVANNALEDAKPDLSCEEGEFDLDLSVPMQESLQGGVAKDCICQAAGYSNIYYDLPAGSRSQCEQWVATQAKAGALLAVVCTLPTILSLVGGTIIEKLATMERSPSRTSLNNSILVMSCGLNVLYLGILQMILNRHELDFSQGFADITPEWFALVGSQVLITLFATVFYPLLGAISVIGFHFSRWRSTCKSKCTKEELMACHIPPHFPIAVQEAATLSELIATLLFSSCMPFLWFFSLVRVPLYYFMDKWVLLRGCHRPPRFDHHMALSLAKCVQVAAWLHSVLAVWTYGNPNLMVSAANLDIGKDLDGVVGGEISLVQEFMTRLRRAPALPNSLVLGCISLAFVLRVALFIQGESSHYSLSMLGLLFGRLSKNNGGGDKKDTQGGGGILSKEFSQEPLTSMKDRKLITSYEMVTNSEYGKALVREEDPKGQALVQEEDPRGQALVQEEDPRGQALVQEEDPRGQALVQEEDPRGQALVQEEDPRGQALVQEEDPKGQAPAPAEEEAAEEEASSPPGDEEAEAPTGQASSPPGDEEAEAPTGQGEPSTGPAPAKKKAKKKPTKSTRRRSGGKGDAPAAEAGDGGAAHAEAV